MDNNAEDLAFPNPYHSDVAGMTKLEFFTAIAMGAAMSDGNYTAGWQERVAFRAVSAARATLRELGEGE